MKLQSRLGYVGQIDSFDPWKSRESKESLVKYVADIASLSYGNDKAKNPQSLFDRIVRLGHLSCLEFVPFCGAMDYPAALPLRSIRHAMEHIDGYIYGANEIEKSLNPATGFLVECPKIIAVQWMRHRAFSYLEQSRRYVKGAKVPFTYYGEYPAFAEFYALADQKYQELIDNGYPAELARLVIPQGMMTRFYVAGFDEDWLHFCRLRNDAHAQPEIQVFAAEIERIIKGKK